MVQSISRTWMVTSKGLTAHILGFVSHTVYVSTTESYHYGAKTAITICKQMSLYSNKALFINQVIGWIWPMGQSLLIPALYYYEDSPRDI